MPLRLNWAASQAKTDPRRAILGVFLALSAALWAPNVRAADTLDSPDPFAAGLEYQTLVIPQMHTARFHIGAGGGHGVQGITLRGGRAYQFDHKIIELTAADLILAPLSDDRGLRFAQRVMVGWVIRPDLSWSGYVQGGVGYAVSAWSEGDKGDLVAALEPTIAGGIEFHRTEKGRAMLELTISPAVQALTFNRNDTLTPKGMVSLQIGWAKPYDKPLGSLITKRDAAPDTESQ
ncbi:MAG: hypothetical protein ACI9VR_002894, partial [Cognaticolwellia sp.]